MGNAMAKPLKTKSEFMRSEMKDRLNTDFEHNKKAIDDLKLPISKKVRNRMAGYIVRKNKREKSE